MDDAAMGKAFRSLGVAAARVGANIRSVLEAVLKYEEYLMRARALGFSEGHAVETLQAQLEKAAGSQSLTYEDALDLASRELVRQKFGEEHGPA